MPSAKPYTTDAVKEIIIKNFQDGKGIREISRIVDRNPSTISRILKRWGGRRLSGDQKEDWQTKKDHEYRSAGPHTTFKGEPKDDRQGVADLMGTGCSC